VRALEQYCAYVGAAERCRRCNWRSSACRRAVSALAATAAGSLLGEGGARKCEVAGLGARERAGEKCCWRVEKAGRCVVLLSG